MNMPSSLPQVFLSTPSARRATLRGLSTDRPDAHISIHALREEGDCKISRARRWEILISIHALREEGDDLQLAQGKRLQGISIHALREEGDREEFAQEHDLEDFYPRPPRGGRHILSGLALRVHWISIHALREEGDLGALYKVGVLSFLSTPSARRATC